MHFRLVEALKGSAEGVPFLENSTFERDTCAFSTQFGVRYVVFLRSGSREIGSCSPKIRLGLLGGDEEIEKVRRLVHGR